MRGDALSAELPTLKAGDLYLRCQGNDQQLDELVVEFVRPK